MASSTISDIVCVASASQQSAKQKSRVTQEEFRLPREERKEIYQDKVSRGHHAENLEWPVLNSISAKKLMPGWRAAQTTKPQRPLLSTFQHPRGCQRRDYESVRYIGGD